jgi:hypothetical protein
MVMRSPLRLIAVTAALLLAAPASAAPALWRVSDADSHVWLFGSVHMFAGKTDWRTPEFNAALDAADLVYFETEFDMDAYATWTRLSITEGMNRDGETVASFLTPEENARFEAVAAERGLDLASLQRMRPWLANVTLAATELTGGGAGPGAVGQGGVEIEISGEVDPEKQRGLETPEFQFNLLAGGTDEEQADALMETVAAFETGSAADLSLESLTRSWQDGDIEALHETILSSIGAPDDPAYRAMISDRNRNWVEQIDTMLETNEDAMIIVGAGHLAGPEGVPTLLAARGLTVERIGFAEVDAVTPRSASSTSRQLDWTPRRR